MEKGEKNTEKNFGTKLLPINGTTTTVHTSARAYDNGINTTSAYETFGRFSDSIVDVASRFSELFFKPYNNITPVRRTIRSSPGFRTYTGKKKQSFSIVLNPFRCYTTIRSSDRTFKNYYSYRIIKNRLHFYYENRNDYIFIVFVFRFHSFS